MANIKSNYFLILILGLELGTRILILSLVTMTDGWSCISGLGEGELEDDTEELGE